MLISTNCSVAGLEVAILLWDPTVVCIKNFLVKENSEKNRVDCSVHENGAVVLSGMTLGPDK